MQISQRRVYSLSRARAVPCHTSSNCIGWKTFPNPNHYRASKRLEQRALALMEMYGLEYCGFLTLTFGTRIDDATQAQAFWHSVATNILNARYRAWIRLLARGTDGRIHYHVLVIAKTSLRTGIRSPDSALRAEWESWERIAESYSIGRVNFAPVRSMAKVAKYFAKHLRVRDPRDKGRRLVDSSKNARRLVNEHPTN